MASVRILQITTLFDDKVWLSVPQPGDGGLHKGQPD